jgi:hypothetical protein
MAKKSKRISAAEMRRQDQLVMPEAKAPRGFSRMSPRAKARAVLSEPVVGGPHIKLPGSGNWRTQPRNPRNGRFVKR